MCLVKHGDFIILQVNLWGFGMLSQGIKWDNCIVFKMENMEVYNTDVILTV